MARMNLHTMKFSRVYPLYVQKAERNGRSKDEVDRIICWLTGYGMPDLQRQIHEETDVETFFGQATQIHRGARR